MRAQAVLACLACLTISGCASTQASQPASGTLGAAAFRHLERNDHHSALALFDRALVAPQAELQAGRARALLGLGRFAEARTGYEQAILQDPENPDWRVGLGAAYLALGDSAGAVEACDAAIAIDPLAFKAYYNRACAHLQAEAPQLAIADFTAALRLHPDIAEAYNSRGVAFARLGRFAEAVQDFERAARLTVMPDAHANSAAAWYAQGDARKALEELNSAIRLDRTNSSHYTSRGRIYLDLEEADLAAADFEKALALGSRVDDAGRLLAAARALNATTD